MAASHTVRILDGNTFVVCEATGDIEATPTEPTGLFSIDTRFLSKWVLTVNGERLNALSYDDLQYYESRFFLVPGLATHYVDAKLSIIRERAVGGSFREGITILNHDEKAVDLEIRIDAGCDFADLFEVKDEILNKKGETYTEVEPDRLRLGYRRGNFKRETIISSSEPARYDRNGLAYSIHLEPNEQWHTAIDVQTRALGPGGRDLRMGLRVHGAERLALQQDLEEWIAAAPKVNSEHDQVAATYRRCLIDLAALRFSPLSLGGQTLPAAGLPWFMTMFGRDSILTCLQTLPFTPDLSATTLRILAALQGTRFDDFREEDPGRILHEMRYGESAAFEEQPHSPYYGSVDATPLFVVLLDEYERWSGDVALVKELEQECRRALRWIDDYADLVGNGYIWYERRNTDSGLENQCWKDSWDSISYADGTLPPFPRATCEVQGYAYDAKMRAARMAREFWDDPAYAEQLEREARALKERFNRDWWVADGGYYALALDPDGRQCDVLSSNIGHLLWSGIVDDDRAEQVAQHLVGERLFSGWGVRTLAEGEIRYNPIGYHNGTVWPFDTSFCAWGLRRYGFAEEAATIASGILDAARYFDGRLPEAFGGYPREQTKFPVEYPTACSPQAWSTGAPLLLLRTMLGLEPHEGHLAVEPRLPVGMGRIEVLDIPGRWGRVDAFARGRLDLHKLAD
ncbi:amylo-alpha-1,6-glucosidase [Micromonospora endophytica]|uniref:Amylo-alpha-1,6-glucosidase n=1 Tax=Micromonospora endophytica TaxID=515350 RepID=A0A2W2BLJ4_9ACTN|nr:glycogen debranching N-terminal domain-containing protein [Micromonospora endophytica]PZF87955.1 amylo-alpha-1,6-glucosidase [Micromonospora endophytica]RIW41112.1 amylo-alpha-1,6-glucosidase [Micromonospora endophytica]BCJ60631.1 aminotransferase [Micromonospora endophytica]